MNCLIVLDRLEHFGIESQTRMARLGGCRHSSRRPKNCSRCITLHLDTLRTGRRRRLFRITFVLSPFYGTHPLSSRLVCQQSVRLEALPPRASWLFSSASIVHLSIDIGSHSSVPCVYDVSYSEVERFIVLSHSPVFFFVECALHLEDVPSQYCTLGD